MATTGLIFTLLCLVGIQAGEPPPPTIGDIILEPYTEDSLQGFHQPLIYYTDGTSRPDYGAVCSNSSGEAVGTVLCRQLGYTYIESQYWPTSSPVWFKNIQCQDTSASHILRCGTTPVSSGERHSTNVCGSSKKRLLIKCDFGKPLAPYDGQVALCHSDSAYNNDANKNITSSTSLGVISIYYKDHETWRGVNQKDSQPSLEGNEADAICRQMGFTEAYPGSAMTINASDYTFDRCFSNRSGESSFVLQKGAWMTTKNVKNNGPQRCFGCCYNYPESAFCQECDVTNNIVIRCAFDQSKVRTSDARAGSQSDCELNGRKQVTQCESVDPPPTQNTQSLYNTITSLRVALGFTLVLLFILGPFGLFYLICLYRKTLHSRFASRISNASSEKSRTCCCQFDIDYDDENKHLSEPT